MLGLPRWSGCLCPVRSALLLTYLLTYNVLTPALRNVFDVPVVIMSAIMLGGVLGTLALGLAVLLVQSRKQKELFQSMYRDKTTGLYNKALFLEHLAKAEGKMKADELEQRAKRGEKILSYLFLSMDIQVTD
jgi:hypothetical protein